MNDSPLYAVIGAALFAASWFLYILVMVGTGFASFRRRYRTPKIMPWLCLSATVGMVGMLVGEPSTGLWHVRMSWVAAFLLPSALMCIDYIDAYTFRRVLIDDPDAHLKFRRLELGMTLYGAIGFGLGIVLALSGAIIKYFF